MIEIPLIRPETVRRARLANGLTVLVRHDTSAPVVAVVTHVKAGYFDETDDVVGIAHVLEHMYFKGTERFGVGEISKETRGAGGYLNAHTIYDHTSYYVVLPASGFGRGLEVQADAFAHSMVDAEELDKELEVIIQEAKRKADNPSAVTVETLNELLHDRHRIRRWRIGREPGLRALTRAHVLRFYRNFYRPSNTILCVVGDVDPDEALERVTALYGALEDASVVHVPGPVEEEHAGFRYRELDGDVTQVQLAFGWRSPGTLHPDTPLLDLAAAALGAGRASRLYRAVRERRLAASVAAYDYTLPELGVFVVHTEGPPESASDAARAVWAQVRELRDSGIGRDELWRARRLFEARWVRRLETMEGQASHLASWEALGDWALGDRYLERLLSAEVDQVLPTVRRYLAPERCGLVAYRPAGSPRLATDARAMLRALGGKRPAPLPVPSPRVPAPPPGSRRTARPEEERAGVRVYRTANGIATLVRRKRGAPLVHLGVYSLGGASEEDARYAGLTHLLARSAIKGTTHRTATQVAEDAELLGGAVTPHASADSFGWSFSVPTGHALAAIELLADVVQHATIPEEALATERAIAVADLALVRDDMYRHPLRLLVEAAFAGHPYGVPSTGTEETLARIDAGRVRDWHQRRVLAGPTVVAVVGDVDPDATATDVARCFTELEPGLPAPLPPHVWPAAPAGATECRRKAQTALALGFPGPARSDPERFAAQLTATIASGLGGRFFEELRDRRSLAYTVSVFATERRAGGLIGAYIATSPEQEEAARRGLLDEFAKLCLTPVSGEELGEAQRYAIGTHAIRQQSGAAVLADVVDAWLFGDLAELDEYEARVRAVTPDALLALARRCFDESRLVEVVVRGTGRPV